MKHRPEYVHCIKSDPFITVGRTSWCGQKYLPFFVSIEHAAANSLANGRLLTCPQCIRAIVKALKAQP